MIIKNEFNMKVSKKELKECIREAVTMAVKERINEDKWDDMLTQALNADPKAKNAELKAAKDTGSFDASKVSTDSSVPKKKGRPKKADQKAKEEAELAAFNPNDAIYATPNDEDVENNDNVDTDDTEDSEEKNNRTVDFDFASMSSQELNDILAKYPNKDTQFHKKAMKEIIARKHMMDDYNDGCPVPWGYIYSKGTKSIEPDPKHISLGSDGGGAWDGRGADYGGLNFSTAGKGNWFGE